MSLESGSTPSVGNTGESAKQKMQQNISFHSLEKCFFDVDITGPLITNNFLSFFNSHDGYTFEDNLQFVLTGIERIYLVLIRKNLSD